MRRFIFTALAAAVVVAVGIWWLTSEPAGTPQGTPLAPRPPGDSSAGLPLVPSGSFLALPERLASGQVSQDVRERIRSRTVGLQPLFADDQAFEAARQQQVLFTTSVSPQSASQSLLANERRLQDGRQWISYDMRVLAARAEGDRFLLPFPGSSASQAEIDAVEVVGGHYRWTGRILGGSGGTFHITQAFADQYAVGAFKTAEGEYLLEVKSGVGWVANSRDEFVLPPDGNDTLNPAAAASPR